MPKWSDARRVIAGAVLLCLLLCLLAWTLAINLHTAKAVMHFRTNVLWRDQWWFLGELQSVYRGKSWAAILWSPYWGHRPVAPRLLFYLDARLFSFRNTPLLSISWTLLAAQIALLAGVNRAIFGSFRSWRFVAALIVTLNLCLSSFQLENFIWALQVQYILAIFCAVLSFVLFAMSVRANHGRLLVIGSCASALVGSLTMAHGLLIWPVLAMQALLCRSGRRVWAGFLAVFLLAGVIYAVGYQAADLGMGFVGQFRRPMRAIEIALIVLGGPLAHQSMFWSVAAGAVGTIVAIAFGVAIHRERHPAWPSVHFSVVLFVAATAVLTVGARISPELLKQQIAHHGEILPSRYLSFGLLFWTSLFALSLWIAQAGRPRVLQALAVVAMLVPCYFVIGYAREQVVVADAWADAFHSLDATGTSFLVDAPDWERQRILWSYRSELEEWTRFARERRLANFSEDRFLWLNQRLADRFSDGGGSVCEGKIESFDPLGDATWRVNGWAWDRSAGKPPLDVVLTDGGGQIRGLARSGIPHHDTGGHSAEVVIYRAGWLGYLKGVSAGELPKVRAFGVVGAGNGACPIP